MTQQSAEDKAVVSTKEQSNETTEWATGSAYDFLELTPEESAYVDLKLRLSKALRFWRMRKPLSQAALAKKMKSSQSRVAKMERGDPSVTIDLLLRGLILLGVTRTEIARVLVFQEPVPVLGHVQIAATADSTNTVFWSTYSYKERGFSLKRAESSDKELRVSERIHKVEVVYG